MTFRRATLYLGVSAIAAAWLSSAAWSSTPEDPAPAAHASAPAADLHPPIVERKRQLQERMSAAPRPHDPLRNPFEFNRPRLAPSSRSRAASRSVAEDALSVARDLPPLTLIGIAEHQRAEGIARTAVLATHAGGLLMAGVGDVVLDRYTVTAVAAESVAITDGETGTRIELGFETP